MVTRIAPRVIVRLAAGPAETGHMVGRTGYRTLCGETLTSATCPGVALTCSRCCAVAAQWR
jgi:hypothetical protein